jgi:hypothetical protein
MYIYYSQGNTWFAMQVGVGTKNGVCNSPIIVCGMRGGTCNTYRINDAINNSGQEELI